MAGNGQMIIELDRKRMTAMAQKDVATLGALLADDLVYVHFLGAGGYQAEPDRGDAVGGDGLFLGRTV